jgi:hypothetical protein
MAMTIRKATYFSMQVPNRTGQGALMLGALKDAGVNLLAFTGFPHGRGAQVDFVPYDTGAFVRAARKLGLKAGKGKTVFVAAGDDRPGAMAAICQKLADAGINMIAMDAVAVGKKRCGAILWVDPKDVRRASRALGAQ